MRWLLPNASGPRSTRRAIGVVLLGLNKKLAHEANELLDKVGSRFPPSHAAYVVVPFAKDLTVWSDVDTGAPGLQMPVCARV